jgi:hypothetical protein
VRILHDSCRPTVGSPRCSTLCYWLSCSWAVISSSPENWPRRTSCGPSRRTTPGSKETMPGGTSSPSPRLRGLAARAVSELNNLTDCMTEQVIPRSSRDNTFLIVFAFPLKGALDLLMRRNRRVFWPA